MLSTTRPDAYRQQGGDLVRISSAPDDRAPPWRICPRDRRRLPRGLAPADPYPIALTAASKTPAAASFLAFLESPETRRFFAAQGFRVLDQRLASRGGGRAAGARIPSPETNCPAPLL